MDRIPLAADAEDVHLGSDWTGVLARLQGCVRIDFWERRAGGRVLGPARPTGTVATGASACVTASVGSAVWLQVGLVPGLCPPVRTQRLVSSLPLTPSRPCSKYAASQASRCPVAWTPPSAVVKVTDDGVGRSPSAQGLGHLLLPKAALCPRTSSTPSASRATLQPAPPSATPACLGPTLWAAGKISARIIRPGSILTPSVKKCTASLLERCSRATWWLFRRLNTKWASTSTTCAKRTSCWMDPRRSPACQTGAGVRPRHTAERAASSPLSEAAW
uniref:Ntl-dependent gene 5 n=1 Tax=Gasterosteus aculeatus TaxID=69293 RepID=G3P937_GASAC